MNNTIVSTAYILPQSIISNGQTTGNTWTNPSNILLVDGDVSESNPGAGVASDIIIGNFNLNIPQNAVVTGIKMKLIGYRGTQTSPAITITPYLVDNTSGQDVFYPYVTPFTGLTPSMGTYNLGTQNYLFASSFTPDQINNMKIQLISNGDVYVDSFLVQVFYYVPASGSSTPIPSSGCEDCNAPIQVQAMFLQLPFKIGDTKFYLKPGSLTYPDGTPVQPGDVGTCGGEIDFVFDEGKAKSSGGNFEENVILDLYSSGWTVLPSGVIEVDIGSVTNRGIPFHPPFTHDADLMSDHDANSKVVISNNAHFQARFVRSCQADSVFSVPISILDEGVEKTPSVHSINFKGDGVTVTVPDPVGAPHDVDVTITGPGGTTPPSIVSVTSTTSGSTQVSSLSTDLEVTGLNRGAIIQIATEEVVTVTGVTVGGVVATQEAVATDTTNNLRSESWVCVNPPLGSQSVVVTLSSDAYLTFGAECLNNIDTTTTVGDTGSATGSSFAPSTSLTTQYDNSVIIDSLCTAQTPILYTVGAGQISNWSQTANSVTRQGGSSYEQAGLQPDAIVMDYSITQNTPWVITAIEIKGITSTAVAGVNSVTGLDTDNTDPANPVVQIAVDGVTITGDGTAGNPLVAVGGGGGSGSGSGCGSSKLVQDMTAYGISGTGVNTIYTEVIPAGTLGTNNSIRVSLIGVTVQSAFSTSVIMRIKYGGTIVGEVSFSSGGGTFNNNISLQTLIAASGTTSSQESNTFSTINSLATSNQTDNKSSSVDSTINQNLEVEWEHSGANILFSAKGILIEKITECGGGGGGNTIQVTAGMDIDGSVTPKPVSFGNSTTGSPTSYNFFDQISGGTFLLSVGTTTREKVCYTVEVTANNIVQVDYLGVQMNGVVGSPADQLRLSIQTTSGGNPTGTILGSGILSVSGLGNAFTTFANPIFLTPGVYAVVLDRTGAADNSNYWQYYGENRGGTNTAVSVYDGTSWTNGNVLVSIIIGATYPRDNVYISAQDPGFRLQSVIVSSGSGFTSKETIPLVLQDSQGFVTSNVVKDGTTSVSISGAVSGFTGLSPVSNYEVVASNGTIGVGTGTDVGVALTTTSIKI